MISTSTTRLTSGGRSGSAKLVTANSIGPFEAPVAPPRTRKRQSVPAVPRFNTELDFSKVTACDMAGGQGESPDDVTQSQVVDSGLQSESGQATSLSSEPSQSKSQSISECHEQESAEVQSRPPHPQPQTERRSSTHNNPDNQPSVIVPQSSTISALFTKLIGKFLGCSSPPCNLQSPFSVPATLFN